MSKIMSPVLHGAKEEALVQGSEQRYLPRLPAFAPRPCHGEKQPGRPPQGAQGAGCAGRPRSVGTPTWRPGGSAAVPSAGAQPPNLAPSAPGGEGEGALTCDHRATRGLCAGRGSGTPRPSLGPRKHVRRGNGRRPDPARHTRRCDLAHSASHSQVWPGPIFSQVRLFLPQQTNTQRKTASEKDTERRLRSERSAGRCVCHSLSPVRPPSDVYRAGRRDREHKARSRVTQLPRVQRLANGRRPRLHLALCCRTDAAVATRRPCGGQRGPCGSSTQSR